jgi:hypothetical protein
MPMAMVITFPGNYCVGEGNTINKSISIHNLHSIDGYKQNWLLQHTHTDTDGEQRCSKHPGFNPHYMITA